MSYPILPVQPKIAWKNNFRLKACHCTLHINTVLLFVKSIIYCTIRTHLSIYLIIEFHSLNLMVYQNNLSESFTT